MKIFLTGSRWYFNLPGFHVRTPNVQITVWPYDWIWYPKNRKYGIIHLQVWK